MRAFLCSLILFSAMAGYAGASTDFEKTIHSEVLKTIHYSEAVPGLGSEGFFSLKGDVARLWETLVEQGSIEMSGSDKDLRSLFVALQGIVEHVLATELQNNVQSLKGIIHTPMPATPLCTIDPSIEIDPTRLFTVKARATIVRDFLCKGGDLYVVYPKDGLYQRTEEQQAIYKQALMNFPSHLFDVPLDCESIPTNLIGATYFFQDQSGKTFVFAIKMTQAQDPKTMGNFGLWFGLVDAPSVQERVNAVSSYLEQNGLRILKN